MHPGVHVLYRNSLQDLPEHSLNLLSLLRNTLLLQQLHLPAQKKLRKRRNSDVSALHFRPDHKENWNQNSPGDDPGGRLGRGKLAAYLSNWIFIFWFNLSFPVDSVCGLDPFSNLWLDLVKGHHPDAFLRLTKSQIFCLHHPTFHFWPPDFFRSCSSKPLLRWHPSAVDPLAYDERGRPAEDEEEDEEAGEGQLEAGHHEKASLNFFSAPAAFLFFGKKYWHRQRRNLKEDQPTGLSLNPFLLLAWHPSPTIYFPNWGYATITQPLINILFKTYEKLWQMPPTQLIFRKPSTNVTNRICVSFPFKYYGFVKLFIRSILKQNITLTFCKFLPMKAFNFLLNYG